MIDAPARQAMREGVLDAADRVAIRRLSAFVKLAWPLIEPGRPLVWNWHLDAICEHLEAITNGEVNRFILNVPPGHSKTSVVTICWPLWEWLRDPTKRIICASYSDDLAKEASKKRLTILQSSWYRTLIRIEHGRDAWAVKHATQKQVETDRTGFIMATSVDGQATGRHADRVIVDDPLKAQDIYTIRLEKHVSWFNETMRTRVTDVLRAAFVVVQQRLHEADLSGELIKDPEWCHLCLSSEFDPDGYDREREDDPDPPNATRIGWKDPRTEVGEPLFPQRFPKAHLDHEQGPFGLGPIAFSAQHNQCPVAGEGNLLHKAWWKFWSDDAGVPADVSLSGDVDEVFTSWDMTFKKAAKTDFVVGQAWGIAGVDAFLLDQTRSRMSFTDSVRSFESMATRWPQAKRHLVEEKANGAAILDVVKDRVAGLIPINPTESKEARVAAISGLVEGGNVYLPHPKLAHADGTLRYPWVQQLIDECGAFPNGKFDDQVDALSQALLYVLKAVRRKKGWKPTPKHVGRQKAVLPLDEVPLPESLERARGKVNRSVEKKMRRRRRRADLPLGLPSGKWDPDG